MNIVLKHIFKHLGNFISEPEDRFIRIYNKIQQSGKGNFKNLLSYIDKTLNYAFENKNDDLNCFHLHFEKEFSADLKLLIAEFIAIKLFYIGLDGDTQSETNDNIGSQIRLLEKKIIQLNFCPEGASGKNGGNRIYKNWQKEKRETSEKLDFLRNIPVTNYCKPLCILNVQEKTFDKLIDLFKTRAFIFDVNKLKISYGYVILNNSNLNELRLLKIEDDYLLKLIKNLLLFDCESSVKKFADFNYEFLNNLKLKR